MAATASTSNVILVTGQEYQGDRPGTWPLDPYNSSAAVYSSGTVVVKVKNFKFKGMKSRGGLRLKAAEK